jgi:hypothetical protein
MAMPRAHLPDYSSEPVPERQPLCVLANQNPPMWLQALPRCPSGFQPSRRSVWPHGALRPSVWLAATSYFLKPAV